MKFFWFFSFYMSLNSFYFVKYKLIKTDTKKIPKQN